MKKILISIFLSAHSYLSAQNIILFDSIQTQQNNKLLLELYDTRVNEQLTVFKNLEIDKKIRKEIENSYTEFTTDFVKKINQNHFISNHKYDSFFENIVLKIQEKNPNYTSLSKIKILLSYGKTPNAYSIGNDIVVVMIPLIKDIQNEYELAFILCHEIAHNLLNHSNQELINYATLKNSSELKKQTKDIDRQKFNKGEEASKLYKDLVYNNYKNSRKQEHEADSLGYILFRNAFAEKENQALMTLKTLENIDVERDSLSLTDYKLFFDSESFTFDSNWLNHSKQKYNQTSKFWEVDSLKTHPDCNERIDLIKNQFKIEITQTEHPSKEFRQLKELSKYNYVYGLFVIKEYGKSLYETLLLLKHEPDNGYLKNLVYQNLIQLEKAQNKYELNKYLATINPNFSNSYNNFLYFFRQLRKTQLKALITNYEN